MTTRIPSPSQSPPPSHLQCGTSTSGGHGYEGGETCSSSSGPGEEEDVVPLIRRNYRASAIGRIRTISNIHNKEWFFIGFSILLLLLGFGFTFYRMAVLNPGSDEFVFAILVVINLVFAVYYLVHGILQEQPLEILTYIFTTFIIAVLVVINFASAVTEEDYIIRLIRFVVTLFLSLPNIVFALRIGLQYWKSGPFVFKAVGGDQRLQRICRVYLFGMSLVIFDSQAMLSCSVLVVQNGFSRLTNDEIYMLVLGIVVTTLWASVGHMAMRLENIKMTWIFGFLSLFQPLYALYLYVENLEEIHHPYGSRGNAVFVAVVVLLITHFTLLSVLPIIASNYGSGLKEAIYGMEEESDHATSGPTDADITPGLPDNSDPDAILPVHPDIPSPRAHRV